MGYSENMAVPLGNEGMILVAENQDGGSYALPLGFTLRYNNTNVITAYSGGDSYVDFGLGMCVFYINKRDESFNKLYTQQTKISNVNTLRIRFEGNSPWSLWNANNLVWELTIFENGVFQLVMDKLNTTAIGERKFYVPAKSSTVDLILEQGKSLVFMPKDENGMDYDVLPGSYTPNVTKLLAADELNYYTVVDGALKSILITEPLTAAQFMEHGSAEIPDTLLAPLYNARVLLWSQQPATLTATATATVPPQTLVTTMADMSNKTITGIQNVVCDVSGECLIAICWEGGESNSWEYFDGGEWQTATESRWGMTAAVLSAITTAQWTSYLATKSSRQYRFRFMMAQGDGLKSVKIKYLNQ